MFPGCVSPVPCLIMSKNSLDELQNTPQDLRYSRHLLNSMTLIISSIYSIIKLNPLWLVCLGLSCVSFQICKLKIVQSVSKFGIHISPTKYFFWGTFSTVKSADPLLAVFLWEGRVDVEIESLGLIWLSHVLLFLKLNFSLILPFLSSCSRYISSLFEFPPSLSFLHFLLFSTYSLYQYFLLSFSFSVFACLFVTPSSHLLLFSSPASRLTHLFPFLVILSHLDVPPCLPWLAFLALPPSPCYRCPAFFTLPFLPFFTRLTPAPHDTTILVTRLAIFCSLYVRTYKRLARPKGSTSTLCMHAHLRKKHYTRTCKHIISCTQTHLIQQSRTLGTRMQTHTHTRKLHAFTYKHTLTHTYIKGMHTHGHNRRIQIHR